MLQKLAALMICILLCMTSTWFGVKRIEAVQKELPGEVDRAPDAGKVSIHDPSVLKAEENYYVFGSHLAVGKSNDLIRWGLVTAGVNDSVRLFVPEGETLRSVLREPLSWTDAFQIMRGDAEDDLQTGIWAPSVIYNETMGKYCWYACSSVWGVPHSVIWLATADAPEGPYTYRSSLIYSGFNKKTQRRFFPLDSLHYLYTNIGDLIKQGVFTRKEIEAQPWFTEFGDYDVFWGRMPNAIDPTVFADAQGGLWLCYGSFSGGVYVMPLIEETGLPDYKYMRNTPGYDIYFGKQISKTNEATDGTGEGPFIVYDREHGYYYFYLTYGGLGATDRYQIREYRSTSPDGPYTDAAGNDALEMKNTGLLLFGNYKFAEHERAYLSGGHSSCLIDDDGKMFQVYHTRFNDGVGFFRTTVHQMAVNEDGWAVTLPLEYHGETVSPNGYSLDAICGEYEFILHESKPLKTDVRYDWDNIEETVNHPVDLVLEPDGRLMKSGVAAGVWTVTDRSPYLTLTVDGVTYRGVLCVQSRESGSGSAMTFAACGSNNATVWGVKK